MSATQNYKNHITHFEDSQAWWDKRRQLKKEVLQEAWGIGTRHAVWTNGVSSHPYEGDIDFETWWASYIGNEGWRSSIEVEGFDSNHILGGLR